MKKIILISFCLCFSYHMMAQLSVNYSFGYGSYKMGDMKDFLENMRLHVEGQYPGLGVAIVDNYPAYMTHSVDIGYRIKSHEIGVRSSFLSTGGKLSRQDQTGEYEAEVTVNGYRQALFYRYYILAPMPEKKRKVSVFAELSPSVIISRVKINEHLAVYENILESDKLKVDKVGFSCLPQVGARYNFIPQIGVQLTAGYEISFGPAADKLAGNPKIDWSGVRVSGGVSLTF